MKKIILLLFFSFVTILAKADAVEINGLYYIMNTELKEAEVTHGNWDIWTVTTGDGRYSGDIIIPESVLYGNTEYKVTKIADFTFRYCSSVTSISIPNTIKNIGENAFGECSNLTSLNIPEGVTYLNISTAQGCSSLNSLTLPQSLTGIDGGTFESCNALTTITIPSKVKSIGAQAFKSENIITVISEIEEPFAIEGKDYNSMTFSIATFNNATLYVPEGTVDKYKATDGWKDFSHIKNISEMGTPPSPITKCDKPIISYADGKIDFTCSTAGVEFVSSVTSADVKSYSSSSITLTLKFTVSVYATKAGCDNSDVATKDIEIVIGDMDGNGTLDAADVVKLVNKVMGK